MTQTNAGSGNTLTVSFEEILQVEENHQELYPSIISEGNMGNT